ncbi:MAG: flavodoxin family protein [Candidatus Izemoplasma sp.]
MILILNGSPNKDSKSLSIVNEILRSKTEEVVIINAYSQNIFSCDDCKYCTRIIGCSKSDDMTNIHELLMKASTLIVSSPIYFGALSDKVLTIINRFQRYYGQKFDIRDSNIPRLKNLIFVNTAGSKKSRMFNGVKETQWILSKLFQPENSLYIHVGETDKNVPLTRKKVINKINKIRNVL